jgi:hypothetical protein
MVMSRSFIRGIKNKNGSNNKSKKDKNINRRVNKNEK